MGVELSQSQRQREISEGFHRGERWAFDAVAREYFAYIVNFITTLLRDRDRALELAQEAFFLACRAHQKLDPKRDVAPWMFQIARNLAYKEYNKRQNQLNISLDDTMEDSFFEPETKEHNPRQESSNRELQSRINRAILRLKPRYRDILILRMMQGVPGDKVAEMLKIPSATVNTRLHRALKHLRKYARQEGIMDDEVLL